MSTSETNGMLSPTFALERFAWDAPDRLEVSGWFSGLRNAPADAPVLVVRGTARTHRLPAVPNGSLSVPEDGRRWWATFAWQEAPEAFEGAELEFGADIAVELPEPRPEREAFGDRLLAVRRSGGPSHDPAEHAGQRPTPSGGAERLRLEAQLLAEEEEARDLRAAVQRSGEELARAHEDLQAERERRASDAERFREGLERVRASAEEALAAEQGAAQRLDLDLRNAHAEIDALREHVAVLERAGEEAHRLRSQLDAARERADEARARLREAQRPATEARAEAERLLGRLITIESSLDDERTPA